MWARCTAGLSDLRSVVAAPREPFASFGFRVPDVARVFGVKAPDTRVWLTLRREHFLSIAAVDRFRWPFRSAWIGSAAMPIFAGESADPARTLGHSLRMRLRR